MGIITASRYALLIICVPTIHKATHSGTEAIEGCVADKKVMETPSLRK